MIGIVTDERAGRKKKQQIVRAHPGLIIISVLIKSRTTTRIRDSREVQIGAWAGGNACSALS